MVESMQNFVDIGVVLVKIADELNARDNSGYNSVFSPGSEAIFRNVVDKITDNSSDPETLFQSLIDEINDGNDIQYADRVCDNTDSLDNLKDLFGQLADAIDNAGSDVSSLGSLRQKCDSVVSACGQKSDLISKYLGIKY